MDNNFEYPEFKYLDLYKYLPVLSEEQIVKLRKIATGILGINAFSDEELSTLENKLQLEAH
jgi:hypothetical protein